MSRTPNFRSNADGCWWRNGAQSGCDEACNRDCVFSNPQSALCPTMPADDMPPHSWLEADDMVQAAVMRYEILKRQRVLRLAFLGLAAEAYSNRVTRHVGAVVSRSCLALVGEQARSAWSAWVTWHRLEMSRQKQKNMFASMLGRRARLSLSGLCLRAWSEVVTLTDLHALKALEQDRCSDLERTLNEANVRADHAEAELLRRSSNEFQQLRQLQHELQDLRCSFAATSQSAQGIITEHKSPSVDAVVVASTPKREGSTLSPVATRMGTSWLRLYLCAWHALAAQRGMAAAFLAECSSFNLINRCTRVFCAWRSGVACRRGSRENTRLNDVGAHVFCAPLTSLALRIWRDATAFSAVGCREPLQPSRDTEASEKFRMSAEREVVEAALKLRSRPLLCQSPALRNPQWQQIEATGALPKNGFAVRAARCAEDIRCTAVRSARFP